MAFFTKDFTGFFKDLEKNNSTDWFNENRKRYEAHVKKPFGEFIAKAISMVQKTDPSVKIKPADAITRINKDIRFSKDKTPYNTYVGAVISAAGKKDKSVPGLYLQLSNKGVVLFGGAYMLDPAQLKKVRGHIAADLAGFARLYKDKNFVKFFGGIRGEQSKRLDAEWQSLAGKEPLIANKQFYFNAELKGSEVVSDKLLDFVIDHYKAAMPVNSFLQQALGAKN